MTEVMSRPVDVANEKNFLHYRSSKKKRTRGRECACFGKLVYWLAKESRTSSKDAVPSVGWLSELTLEDPDRTVLQERNNDLNYFHLCFLGPFSEPSSFCATAFVLRLEKAKIGLVKLCLKLGSLLVTFAPKKKHII